MKTKNITKAVMLLSMMSASAFAQSVKVPVLDTNSAIFGAGFNNDSEVMANGACVTGPLVADGKPSSSFSLKFDSDRKRLENMLGLDAGARIVSGATTTKIGADYLKHTIEDSHSITLNYVAEYNFSHFEWRCHA
jgi:hypothetical protein